jgi:hypothetical protein
VLVAAVLVAYILGTMPGIRGFAGRLGRCSPLTRVILIRDQIVTKAGGNVLGNLLTSVVAGTGGCVWMPTPDEVTLRHLDGP